MASPSRPSFDSVTEADAVPESGVVLGKDVSSTAVPRLSISPRRLRALPVDHRTGFVLWLIDGKTSVADIADMCPTMRRQEVTEILRALRRAGAIVLD